MSGAADPAPDAPPPQPAAQEPASPPPNDWLPAQLRSLRHRNFRLLWIGSLVSNSGDWMDQVALNWLVYQLTGSALDLGWLNFARLAPILVFTLIGGVVADRVERRSSAWSLRTGPRRRPPRRVRAATSSVFVADG